MIGNQDNTDDPTREIERVALDPEQSVDVEPCESLLTADRRVDEQPIPPFHPSLFVNYTWEDLDAASLPRLAQLDPKSRRMYEKLGRLPIFRRYDLGTFQTEDCQTVSFEAIPALGEVAYSEIAEPVSGGTSPEDSIDERESPSPLLRFLQLTDRKIPVPMILREFDDRSDDPEVERALAGRDLVDSLDNAGTPAPTLAAAQPSAAAASSFCSAGGADAFSAAKCASKDLWYCDSGAWVDLTRSTGSKRRWVSHSRVAACGGFSTYVEHQFRFWKWTEAKWKWTAVKYPYSSAYWQVVSPGGYKYWKHVGNKKRRRRIRMWTTPSAGSYLRAWTSFYN